MTKIDFLQQKAFTIVDAGHVNTAFYNGELDEIIVCNTRKREHYPVTFMSDDGVRASYFPSLFNRKIDKHITWFFCDMKII